jgi:hypothetical protein
MRRVNMIRRLILVLCFLAGGVPSVFSQTATDTSPPIPLFDSVERVRSFLAEEAEEDYTGMYLSGITLHYFESTPREGLAWVYSYSFRIPRLGGEICICHFMDGTILEYRLGP